MDKFSVYYYVGIWCTFAAALGWYYGRRKGRKEGYEAGEQMGEILGMSKLLLRVTKDMNENKDQEEEA